MSFLIDFFKSVTFFTQLFDRLLRSTNWIINKKTQCPREKTTRKIRRSCFSIFLFLFFCFSPLAGPVKLFFSTSAQENWFFIFLFLCERASIIENILVFIFMLVDATMNAHVVETTSELSAFIKGKNHFFNSMFIYSTICTCSRKKLWFFHSWLRNIIETAISLEKSFQVQKTSKNRVFPGKLDQRRFFTIPTIIRSQNKQFTPVFVRISEK